MKIGQKKKQSKEKVESSLMFVISLGKKKVIFCLCVQKISIFAINFNLESCKILKLYFCLTYLEICLVIVRRRRL